MSGLFAILMAVGCTSSPTGPEPATSTNEPTTGTPGKVTDLIVTDSSGTSVALAFTEVDDGHGYPADYTVRMSIGPMDWGSAKEVVDGTCAAPVQGTAIGARMSCRVEGLLPDTPYTFQVAAFRGTLQANAVFGELSNIVPDMEADPTSGSASYPNEPGGLSTIASVDFTNGINAQIGACTEHSDTWKRSNTEYIGDSSAPTGDGSVFRGKFPSGMADGVSPWRFDCWGPGISESGGHQYDELYIAFWMKIEGGDFENQTNGTKMFYLAYGDNNRTNQGYGILWNGTGDQAVQPGPLKVRWRNTAEYGGSDAYSDEVFPIGEWVRVEYYFKLNDDGARNGIVRWWVNGKLAIDASDAVFINSSLDATRGFYHLQFTPVWGGNSGDIKTRDDHWRLDNLYVSGR